MSRIRRLSRSAIEDLVHQALAARVRVLLGQIGYEELMAVQERVAHALAEGAWHWHGSEPESAYQAMAQAVLDAFDLGGIYYSGSSLDYILSEGLAGAGMHVAEAIAGHEQDRPAAWAAQVVPQLDRIQAQVVSVFAGHAPAVA